MTIDITLAESDDDIAATFDVMHQLRPHLERDGYVARVRELMAGDGLRVLALRDDGVVRAVGTYRLMDMLYRGKLMYIDDLVTDETVRSRGYGSRMIERFREEALALGCNEIQLISRTLREQAHRFYFREGFGIECFHFRLPLDRA